MCTPMAVMGMQGAGAASSALGAWYGAKSQQDRLSFSADMADLNARTVMQAGERDQQKSMLAAAHLKSAQRAGMGANGVDLGAGTAANVLTSTDVMGKIDANTIEANALRSAWGYRTQAIMDRASAGTISPLTAAATSLLGSASSVAGSWYSMNKAGAMPSGSVTGSWLDPVRGDRGGN